MGITSSLAITNSSTTWFNNRTSAGITTVLVVEPGGNPSLVYTALLTA
jgi:hypothetical protein